MTNLLCELATILVVLKCICEVKSQRLSPGTYKQNVVYCCCCCCFTSTVNS